MELVSANQCISIVECHNLSKKLVGNFSICRDMALYLKVKSDPWLSWSYANSKTGCLITSEGVIPVAQLPEPDFALDELDAAENLIRELNQ